MEFGYNTYTKESNYSIGYGTLLFDGDIINNLFVTKLDKAIDNLNQGAKYGDIVASLADIKTTADKLSKSDLFKLDKDKSVEEIIDEINEQFKI